MQTLDKIISPGVKIDPQDRMWIFYINKLLDAAIELGKKADRAKLYGDFQLLLEFFKGDEEKAGAYFMSYCTNVRNCPEDFIKFCEDLLVAAGIPLPTKPLPSISAKYLQAAE